MHHESPRRLCKLKEKCSEYTRPNSDEFHLQARPVQIMSELKRTYFLKLLVHYECITKEANYSASHSINMIWHATCGSNHHGVLDTQFLCCLFHAKDCSAKKEKSGHQIA